MEKEELRQTIVNEEKKRMKNKLLRIGLIIFVCLFFLVLGILLREHTTLFVQNSVVDGYLNLEDFQFTNTETGKIVNPYRRFVYQEYYISARKSGSDSIVTSKGIGIGDSWEDFLEVYGDYTTGYISFYPVNEDGSINYENGEILSNVTPNEFNEIYFESGEYNADEVDLSVSFYAYTTGTKTFYADEIYDHISYNRLFHPLSEYPQYGTYSLVFSFEPDFKSNYNTFTGIQYISISYYYY